MSEITLVVYIFGVFLDSGAFSNARDCQQAASLLVEVIDKATTSGSIDCLDKGTGKVIQTYSWGIYYNASPNVETPK